MKNVVLVSIFSALSLCSLAQFEFKHDSIEKRNKHDINDIDALYQVSGKGDFQLLFGCYRTGGSTNLTGLNKQRSTMASPLF
jgi:hypothetical protein